MKTVHDWKLELDFDGAEEPKIHYEQEELYLFVLHWTFVFSFTFFNDVS